MTSRRRAAGAKPRPLAGSGRPEPADKVFLGTVLSTLSEREFQAMVVAGLKQRGYIVWVVPNMRMTVAGLPDIIAVHPDRAPLLMLELKTAKGRVRPPQVQAIEALQNIPGIYAAIVRPADWEKLKDEV